MKKFVKILAIIISLFAWVLLAAIFSLLFNSDTIGILSAAVLLIYINVKIFQKLNKKDHSYTEITYTQSQSISESKTNQQMIENATDQHKSIKNEETNIPLQQESTTPSKKKNNFVFNIAGVTYENDKGKDIQSLIKKTARKIATAEGIKSYGGWTNKEIIEYGQDVSEFEDVELGEYILFEKVKGSKNTAIKIYMNLENDKVHIGYVPKQHKAFLTKLLATNSILNIRADVVGGKIKEVDFDLEKDKEIVVINEDDYGVEITLYYKDLTEEEENKYNQELEVYHEFLKYSKIRKLPKDFTIIHFETTGISAEENKIIHMSAVKYRDLNSINEFESFINPQEPIAPTITKINGIKDQDVQNAQPIEDVLPQILDFIGEDPIVSHNAPFYMDFLLTSMYKNNIPYRKFKVVDTLTLARKSIHDSQNHKLATLEKYLKIEDQKLGKALHDCYVTGEFYRYCYNKNNSENSNATN